MIVLTALLFSNLGVSSQEEKRSEVISAMISLFDNQRSDMGLCVVLFSFVNRLSGEGFYYVSSLE